MQVSDVLDLSKINDENMVLTIVDMFQDIATGEKGFRKDAAQDFFKLCHNNLESQKVDPITKFYTIFVPLPSSRCSRNSPTRASSRPRSSGS